MNNSLFILFIFWGVWIIIPVIFDGILTFIYMLVIMIKSPKLPKHQIDSADLPKVTIIIPTYNEEDNINECLNYLKLQNYPQEKMEIIVVDNGSTDKTSQIVKEHMLEVWQIKHGKNKLDHEKLKVDGDSYEIQGFGGVLRLVIRYERGKAKALNAGIKLAQGDIIINIDCRSFLAPDAITNMVAKFVENPEYGAATGNVEIDWDIIYQKDFNGEYIMDQNGYYVTRQLSHKERFLGKSQFMEYLTSFRLGRQFQDITGSMFTFSGAFSAFRRDVLLNSSLYKSRTVAEDTDLTLDLQGQKVRLGFAADSKAYLKPVLSFERFYAQRVRWHRGQIEVIGVHLDWYGDLTKGFWRNFWLAFLLMIDHTFGFPRIIWMFLLPIFFLFGYSVVLIIEAIALMYALYIFLDFVNILYCYQFADIETRAKIKESIQYCIVTPIFRILTFFFRFAAYLEVLKEPQAWTTQINPVKSVKGYRRSVRGGYHRTLGFVNKIVSFITGAKPQEEYFDDAPEFDTYGLEKPDEEIRPSPTEFEVSPGRQIIAKSMDGIYYNDQTSNYQNGKKPSNYIGE